MAYTTVVVPRSFGWGGVNGETLRGMLIQISANDEDQNTRVTDLEEAVNALDPEALEGVEGLGERLTALEETVDTEGTGVKDVVDALVATVDTADTGLTDRVEVLEAAVEALDPEALEGVEGLDERITALEGTVDTAETGLTDRVEALETTVDTAETGVVDRLEALETTVDTAETGLADRVEALETTVDTAETGLSDRMDAVEETLDTAETGIVDRVEALETTIDTAETGIADRVEALETTIDTAETGITDRVEALETTIDTAETGVVARVDALENTVGGEATGLVKEVADLSDAFDAHESATVHRYTVPLAGRSPSKFAFQAASAAAMLGTEAGPFALDNGETFIVTGDGVEQTLTFAATAGTHTGGTSASTDMTAETDTKIKIRANGDETWHTIACDWVGGSCDSGAEIAAELQSKIRAIGATYGYDAIVVAFDTNKYVFTSAQKGTGSTIEIAYADDHDACDELDIGPNGVTAVGTGDAANIAAATIGEVIIAINAALTKLTATDGTTGILLTSKTTGHASGIVIGAGTKNAVLGFTQAADEYGVHGLGADADMADANYVVFAGLSGTAQNAIAGKGLSVTQKATTGFELECETAAATDNVGLIVFA